jgi:hypothetical protein
MRAIYGILVSLLIAALAVSNAYASRAGHALPHMTAQETQASHTHDHSGYGVHAADGQHEHAGKAADSTAGNDCCAACVAAAFIFSVPAFDRPLGAETLSAAIVRELSPAAPEILIPPPRFA